MWPEGLSHLEIEPATFRFVAQCLKHLYQRVPQLRIGSATKVVQNNSLLFRIGLVQRYYRATLKLKFTGCIKNISAYKDTMDINLNWVYSL